MVFKPFKPPLIRKPEQLTETTDANDHPAKKPRLGKDEATSEPHSRPTPTLGRKPLLQVRNIGKDSTAKTTNGASNKEDASFERFFNALWYACSKFP
jgi:DNA repair and recombination protein RAD54B